MKTISDRPFLVWASVTALVAGLVVFSKGLGPPVTFPETLVVPVTDPMNAAMRWFVDAFGWLFKAVAWLFDWPILFAKALLHSLPWAAWFVLTVYVAFRSGGPGLAVFTALSLLYMVTFGFWTQSINSFALVVVSIPLAVALGFAVGTWGFKSDRAYRVIMPVLDLMQTVPAFAYLLPILLLFGFGTTVGLVASILFAFPPMVRNTIVGLRCVSDEVIESGLMSGATPAQLFWSVRVPTAQRQILLGVNQTTMASLSMVIIASIIGGTNDIGWEVLSTIRKAQFGESLLAGIVIALMAMILDRITWGFAVRSNAAVEPSASGWKICAASFAAAFILAYLFPALREWPEAWIIDPAPSMNAALEWLFVEFRATLEAIKTAALFYIMLPIKIGLSQAVSPFTWGFAVTPVIATAYALVAAAIAIFLIVRGKHQKALGIILFCSVLYVGLTGLSWLALCAIIVALAWQAGGKNLALWVGAGLAFLLLTGIWEPAVVSLYLCGVGVLLAFSLGSAIGVWASENNTLSRIVRPIIDTLQTMPLFVILIPFVMVFKIGEFTALLAIVVYAIVPAIRYTEHGLRNLPRDVIEAAIAIGTTRRQLLWQVKLPLAVPSIMLGLNQTIMFGISMLVITALVGTDDLGQQIYIGLGDGDFGVGMTAGIGMAIIAMTADRITQGFNRQIQSRLGTKLDNAL
ncbi:MAG: ABC transporter permease subunit [Rhodospirillales bacterium]|nr:ABC transporter permease subunit [Rhodospirillales bacterium]